MRKEKSKMSNNTKKKSRWKIVIYICAIAFGIVIGLAVEKFYVFNGVGDFLVIFAASIVSLIVHVIFHEAGHLIFGLLSGYKFLSFRIFNIIWLRQNDGKIKLKRHSVPGTVGQCLMGPPETKDGNFPFIAYNFGGVLMNILLSIIAIVLLFLIDGGAYVAISLIIFVLWGMILALTNGIPMKMELVNNDGYNALELQKNSEARRAFWLQLKIYERIAMGERLREMPSEWFEASSENADQSYLGTAINVMAGERLMDQCCFEEYLDRYAEMMQNPDRFISLHRHLMTCNAIYSMAVTARSKNEIDGLWSKELRAVMTQLKKNPSIIRTEYAYALICERDKAKAAALKERFEAVAKNHPFPCEIVNERELFKIAEDTYEKTL